LRKVADPETEELIRQMIENDEKEIKMRQEEENQKSACQICMCALDEVDEAEAKAEDAYDDRPLEDIVDEINRRRA